MNIDKQLIIIFGGHDYSGKSTIAKYLSDCLNIPIFKDYSMVNKVKKDNVKTAFMYDQDYIVQFLEQTKYSVIFDRGYESEWVYNKVFSHKIVGFSEQQYLNQMKFIDTQFAQLDTKIIICEKDIKFANFKDDMVDFNDIELIKKTYDKFIKWTACDCIKLSTTKEDIVYQIRKINNFLIQKKEKK